MSALHRKRTNCTRSWHVRFVPIATECSAAKPRAYACSYGMRYFLKMIFNVAAPALAPANARQTIEVGLAITSDGRGPMCGLWGTSISCLHDQVLAKSMTAMHPD